MPMQQKLALASNAPLRQHIPGHGVDCPGCHDIAELDERGGDIHPSLSFEEAAEKYLALRELAGGVKRARYVSPRTLRDDRQYLRALGIFFNGLKLDAIHLQHFRDYQMERSNGVGLFGEREGSNFSQTNSHKVNQELGVVQRILKKAGLWTPEFEQHYQRLQTRLPDVPRALSPQEQKRFLEVASSCERWQVVYWYILVALDTTCSHTEMRHLRLGDINLFQRIITICEAGAKNVHRAAPIPLSETASWGIDRLLQRARALGSFDPGHHLFPFRISREVWDPSRPMTEWGLREAFEEIREEAGVSWLTFHGLRHTAITRMAEAGIPIEVIMSFARHVRPQMTRHYTHISAQAQRKALNKLAAAKQVEAISTSKGWKGKKKTVTEEAQEIVDKVVQL